MKRNKDKITCLLIVIVLSILDLLAKPIANFLILLFSNSAEMESLYITAISINFIYLSLTLCTFYYFFNKKVTNK
nr:hypothetical protein Z967_p0077 [Clostridium novyi A str. 4540]